MQAHSPGTGTAAATNLRKLIDPPKDLQAFGCKRDRFFTDLTSTHGATAVLVRPDRYVYGIAAGHAGLGRQIRRVLERLGT
ncbi:MAG: hypothetical protein AB7E55_20110 [Pigmentiphaga sp.]